MIPTIAAQIAAAELNYTFALLVGVAQELAPWALIAVALAMIAGLLGQTEGDTTGWWRTARRGGR